MKRLIIAGAGPRGLGLALYALKYSDLDIILIDESPISSWTSPNIIPDIVMRSPASFDLVTGYAELEEYSLSKYMSGVYSNYTTQKDIEADTTEVRREVFLAYLESIKAELLSSNRVVISNDSIEYIAKDFIKTKGRQFSYNYLALCMGNKGERKIPLYIKNSSLRYKTKSLSSFISDTPEEKRLCVIGSGQGAAELVYFLASKNNYVYWVRYDTYRENQYPIPSYSLWGDRSALGSYYSTLTTYKEKNAYLAKVKEFTPSLTPYIVDKLNRAEGKYEVVKYNRSDIANYLTSLDLDSIGIMTGIQTSASAIQPLFSHSLPLDKYNSNFPFIVDNFRLFNTNIFISGALATYYDGPRQNSVISIGSTSSAILEEINK